jgi:hypothetical protein
MKVLISVLGVRDAPYGEMTETSKATWDSVDVPGVETIYYVGEPDTPLQDKVMGTPVQEGYETIGYKNLIAWKWMLENRECDFLARVNASCYVHKARLLEHCKQNPATRFLTGGIVTRPGKPEWLWGGYQFVMSRDVVQALVDNPQVWNHRKMEDVALSFAATALGIPFVPCRDVCSIDRTDTGWQLIATNGNSFEFTGWDELSRVDDQVFFRVKQDDDRLRDAVVMRNLLTHLKP